MSRRYRFRGTLTVKLRRTVLVEPALLVARAVMVSR
jgi:hypothetical protein